MTTTQRARQSFRQLLSVHRRHQPAGALRRSFGDGYLVHHNRVVRNARRRVLSLGYTLTSRDVTALDAWPLMSLGVMLERRLIPYRDTVSLIEAFEARSPGRFTANDLTSVSRPNLSPVLHESAHVIAHEAIARGRRRLGLPRSRTAPEALFEALFGEAVANATETLAASLGRTSTEQFFLNYFHSHVGCHADVRAAVGRLRRTRPLEDVFRVEVAAYLYFNFLFKAVDASDIAAALDALGLDPVAGQERPAVRALFTAALGMNPTSRVYTAFNYHYFMQTVPLRKIDEYLAVLRFDFLEHLKHPLYRAVVQELATTLLAR